MMINLNSISYWSKIGAIALSYHPRVRVRATAKLSATFFHDESSITVGGGGVRKCDNAQKSRLQWAIPEKNQIGRRWGGGEGRRGVRIWNFQGHQRNSM